MQQAARMKGFVVDHVNAMLLAIGIIVLGLFGAAILAAIDNRPVVGSDSSSAAQPTFSDAQYMDRADAMQQLRGNVVPASQAASRADFDRADAIVQVQGGIRAPTLNDKGDRAAWVRLTHRYWTPEIQSRLVTGL